MRVILYLFLFTGFTWVKPVEEVILNKFEKKVDRLLKNTFGKEAVLIEAASFPNISTTVPDRSFYTLSREENSLGFMVINKAYGCQEGGCNAGIVDKNAKYEDFWYAVVFNADYQIRAVKVLDYQSEYGYEICAKNWLKQFEGYKGCDLEYGSKEVDAISGATVSGRSIVIDINNLCWLLR